MRLVISPNAQRHYLAESGEQPSSSTPQSIPTFRGIEAPGFCRVELVCEPPAPDRREAPPPTLSQPPAHAAHADVDDLESALDALDLALST